MRLMARAGFGVAMLIMASTGVLAQQNKAPPKAAPASTAAAAPAGAQTFLLGTFNDWKTLMSGKDKNKICYVLAEPKERKPAGLKRDPAYIFISNRTADGTKNEIAFQIGFSAKPGAPASAEIGTTKFDLLTDAKAASGGKSSGNSSAFLTNSAQENQFIDLMKRGNELIVKTTSLKGNETVDRYVLAGFGKAHELLSKTCP
jgi:hypothetical protein